MKIKQRRTFIYISNIVISVICLASMLGYFLMPVFRAEFSVAVTPELAEQAAEAITVTGDSLTVNTGTVNAEEMQSVIKNVIRSIGESGLKVSFSSSFPSYVFVGALYDRSVGWVGMLIDDAVDQFVNNAGEVISALIKSLASVAAKEVVKAQVGEIVKSNGGESFDGFMEEIGKEKSTKIDSLIERLIKAITDENATVDSVTETALESADEVKELLSGTDKYSEAANSYGEEDKKVVREMCDTVLSRFADGNGKLQFKEALVNMLLGLLNEAVENGGIDVSEFGGTAVYTSGALTAQKTGGASSESLISSLKNNIKKAFYTFAGGRLPDAALAFMAVAGALILIIMFCLFYPILRTLTNIGKAEPGFSLALPILGGIIPFTFLVLIPSAAPAIFKGLLSGRLFEVPKIVTEAVNSVNISYFSGAVISFFAAIALFIFGFFYGRQRKLLRRELKAAEAQADAQKAAEPEVKAEPVEEKQS